MNTLSHHDPLTDAFNEQRFAEIREWIGSPVQIFDAMTGHVRWPIPVTNDWLPESVLERLRNCSESHVIDCDHGLLAGLLPIPELEESEFEHSIAVMFASENRSVTSQHLPSELIGSEDPDTWLAARPETSREFLHQFLAVTERTLGLTKCRSELELELDVLTAEVEKTYEELHLLHSVTQNLHLSRPPRDLAQVCLDRLRDRLECETCICLLDPEHASEEFFSSGISLLTETETRALIESVRRHDWTKPLVRNHLLTDPAGEFPDRLENFVLVPIEQRGYHSGWILCANNGRGQDFGSVEGSLMQSVAAILGTHLRNLQLYRDHEELLISLVRSFVSSLDAKDPYTRGHSERVALIARRLGQELRLPENDIHSIYVSGLLHDIGKIGVDDRVLRKPDRLTDEEFDHIKEHPVIGHRILQGLTNLQHVIPGVRSHHERWDGKGYPDGLRSIEIPLMARVLAVADSFDAMGSDRPYRNGMPIEKVDSILRDGAGRQWDAQIIEAYFSAHDDIVRLCKEYLPGDAEQLELDSLMPILEETTNSANVPDDFVTLPIGFG